MRLNSWNNLGNKCRDSINKFGIVPHMDIATVPMPRRRARRVVRRYEGLLAQVLADAWADWQEIGNHAPVQRGRLGRGARAFDVSDFISHHAKTRFARIGGVTVVSEYGRPLLVLADGLIKIRFKKLDYKFAVSTSKTQRQQMLALQGLQPTLPGMGKPTLLTVGYVLNSAETAIAKIVVVCHLKQDVKYVIDLPTPHRAAAPVVPIAAASSAGVVPPVIRSARQDFARQQALTGGGSSS